MAQRFRNYIGGEWRDATGGEVYPNENPSNRKEVLGLFPLSTPEDAQAAVEAAVKAAASWAAMPGPQRGEILFRVAQRMMERQEELAQALTAEQGKAISESRGEVARAAQETRFSAGEASRIAGEVLPSERPGVGVMVRRQPLGVVAAITPWNFPVVTPMRKIAPALAAGNTVVFKPASATPWTAVLLAEIFEECGLPPGVLNLVIGRGGAIGDVIVDHPAVRGISFTGSSDVGIRLNERASRRLAKVQLELGGKNPAVVLDYPNLDIVAQQIITAAFTCSGQRCTALSRVIVREELAEPLTERLLAYMQAIRVGPGKDEQTQMGPLVSEGQLEQVEAYVRSGLEEGAKLVFGGQRLTGGAYDDGYYFQPTLFTEVAPQMRIAREEIFGPVLPVIKVKDFDEAVAVCNDVRYGLAASVFTRDMSLAERFAEEVDVGMVHINHGTSSQAHVPFGGVKESGLGPYSIGKTNQDFFTDMKVVYWKYDV